MDPAVTIVLPTFNRPRLLRRALASIAAQTFSDFEVIVIDDAGVDPTSVVESFADEIDLKLIRHPPQSRCHHRSEHRDRRGPRDLHRLSRRRRSLPPCASGDPSRSRVTPARCDRVLGWRGSPRRRRRQRTDPISVTGSADVRPNSPLDRQLHSDDLPLHPGSGATLGHFDEGLAVLEDWDLWLRLSARFPMHRIPVVTCE